MTMGVSARDLSDDDLRRELAQLKEKAADIAAEGTSDQQANHHNRTAELEAEFLRRFLPAREDGSAPGSDRSSAPDSSGGAAGAGTSDVLPAGPDEGPITDQPETDQPDTDRPETDQPSDRPTDDPARPANPA
jgi:sarcosine oxidase gamma subunit